MFKKTISVAVLMAFFSISAMAGTAIIELSGENRYKSITLTPEILSRANADLSDLLIKDGNGESVPYFINSGLQESYEENRRYPLTLINSYQKDDAYYFDYKLAQSQEGDVLATSIEVTTNSETFAKNVELFGSYDNVYWEKIQDDKLYKVDGKSKLGVYFTKTEKYTHYRFKLANNLEKISFNEVNLNYSVESYEKSYFLASLLPQFHVWQEDRRTFIEIEGVKHLRLSEITLETDSMFKRTVSTPFGISRELYNLDLNGTSYGDTTLRLGGRLQTDETLILTIQDGDDKPIDLKGVHVNYYADEIIFEGREGLTLFFGQEGGKTAPVYDITKYKGEILKGNIDRLNLGSVTIDASVPLPEPYDYKMIFNVTVTVAAVILGVLILLKLRRQAQ